MMQKLVNGVGVKSNGSLVATTIQHMDSWLSCTSMPRRASLSCLTPSVARNTPILSLLTHVLAHKVAASCLHTRRCTAHASLWHALEQKRP